jgi:transposase
MRTATLLEALRSRFDLAHHGILVAGLLGHLDSLELAIDNLDQRIAYETEPIAELVELLCTIPGVGLCTGQVLIAECGIDMSIFQSVAHLTSWAGICPGTNTSAARGRGRPRQAAVAATPGSAQLTRTGGRATGLRVGASPALPRLLRSCCTTACGS